MPSIDTYTPFICVHCGAAAKFISINEKKPRCDKSTNRCPAIIKKSKDSRDKAWGSEEAKISHMKAMSAKGNSSPKRLTLEYKERVAKKISDTVKSSGRMAGESNPNYKGAITNDPVVREKMRKPKRDSSKMGRWAREAKHRDALSLRNSLRRPKFKRTAIEIKMFEVLTFLGYDVTQEFLIQTKDHRGDGKLFYRHVYDLYVESLNLLIECDGVYWHNSINARKSDTKASYVANERGFRVLRLSETFIKDIDNHMSEFLQILTSDSTFSVLGDFYNTIPTRVSVRDSRI